MNFSEYLNTLGLSNKQHLIVHSSFKKIYRAFNSITPEKIIKDLKDLITKDGSIILPAFTYCFKKSTDNYEIFDSVNSKSKVGLISEIFRQSEDVIRTSSPTHSFSLWGSVTKFFDERNSPESPLGNGSVLEWLTNQPNSFVLILGTDFSSLSYGHYLEVVAKIPWYNYSPWDYMNVLPIGVSTKGEQKLKEIPGCAKGFINFEKYLIENNLLKIYEYKGLSSYFISIKLLFDEGMTYFTKNYDKLLCLENSCQACDSRRRKFL